MTFVITSTIKRKGKVIGRSRIAASDEASLAAIKTASEQARKQAKAYDVARHTGRKSYRKKKPHA